MKLRSQKEGLGLRATVAAVLAKDTLVKITADKTVNKAGSADDFHIGRLSVPAKANNGVGTVECRFKELVEIKGGGALSAGAIVKLAAADGTTGENVAVAWVTGTDAFERAFGVVWKGAGDGGTLEVLTF